MHARRALLAFVVVAGGAAAMPAPGYAQADDSVARTTARLTTVLEAHLTALITDSLHPRSTPSPALERTAQYVATAFARAGLTPLQFSAAGAPAWIQRYPLPRQRRFVYAASAVELGPRDTANFASGTYFEPTVGPPHLVGTLYTSFDAEPLTMGSRHVVLVSGHHTAATLARAAEDPGLDDKVVIYVPPAGVDSTERQTIVAQLVRASKGVVIASDEDSIHFAARVRAAQAQSLVVTESFMRDQVHDRPWPWAAVVRDATLRSPLALAGIDVARVREDTTPVVRPVSFGKDDYYNAVRLRLGIDTVTPVVTAPNVVAFLAGSDSTLRNQVIVLSTHLDAGALAAGPAATGRPDTMASNKMAPDNTAGMASLLALARAFTESGARPRRSLIFFLSSGSAEEEWWGARYFLEPVRQDSHLMVTNISLGSLDQPSGDTLVIDGMDDIDKGPVSAWAKWAAGAYSDLGLRVIDGGTSLTPKSSHYVFMRYMVPSLYIHYADRAGIGGAAGGGDPALPAPSQLARVTHLVFSLAKAVADAPALVRWKPEFRRVLLVGR